LDVRCWTFQEVRNVGALLAGDAVAAVAARGSARPGGSRGSSAADLKSETRPLGVSPGVGRSRRCSMLDVQGESNVGALLAGDALADLKSETRPLGVSLLQAGGLTSASTARAARPRDIQADVMRSKIHLRSALGVGCSMLDVPGVGRSRRVRNVGALLAGDALVGFVSCDSTPSAHVMTAQEAL
jgi:hypothetical protein